MSVIRLRSIVDFLKKDEITNISSSNQEKFGSIPNFCKDDEISSDCNIGAQFTHLHVPSLCKEFFAMRHNIGHSNLHRQSLNKVP